MTRETTHTVITENAQSLSEVESNSVELVVTSPPYPMIEMWDEAFSDLNTGIQTALEEKRGNDAFELMHEELTPIWEEVSRVLVEGGIACINIGDATRKLGDSFRVYPNHATIVDEFTSLGFDALPEILWRKPVNSKTKFMGSGMIPPNAYTTLEHEYILVFRNGDSRRDFPPGDDTRYESAYFWEERNQWFSDLWEDIGGEQQALPADDLRDRSAAYPLEVPYRLINMYSVYGDTVLDPFWGTGTTTLAALASARNSIGYEIDPAFCTRFADQLAEIDVSAFTRDIAQTRLAQHRDFVQQRLEDGFEFDYESSVYGFPVMTKQERDLTLYCATDYTETGNEYHVSHAEVPFQRTLTDTQD